MALNGARQKGQLASVIEFADNNYHVLGANVLLSMNFNETDSTPPIDSTGNYSTSALIKHSTNTPFSDNGSSFDDTSGSYAFDVSPVTGTINIPSSSGITSSVSFNASAATSNAYIFYFQANFNVPGAGTGSTGLGTQYFPNSVGCYFPVGAVTYNASLGNNQWHNITCVYDNKSNTLSMYVDGKLTGTPSSTSFNGTLISGSSKIGIGHPPSGTFSGSSFSGLIDNLQIFSNSLLASQVQKLYAMGVAQHGIALK